MKYFGKPGMVIVDYKKVKKVFTFDENGEYETDDPKLIAWMKKNKNFIRCEESPEYAYTPYVEFMEMLESEHHVLPPLAEFEGNQAESEDTQEDKAPLEDMSYKELQAMAKERGIRSVGVTKEDLIESLNVGNKNETV